MVNIFVVMRLLPVVGVPLPFLSRGGSALLANLIAVGVLLAAARQEPDAAKLLAAGRKAGAAIDQRPGHRLAAASDSGVGRRPALQSVVYWTWPAVRQDPAWGSHHETLGMER